MEKPLNTDCAVIGGGLAGKSTALMLADKDKKVDFFTKTDSLEDCNSYLIAGGLSRVKSIFGMAIPPDSFGKHFKDTIAAGKGLCDEEVVNFCVKNFNKDIKWLRSQGVSFDKSLHKEGGHSAKRIVHSKDTTGVVIMQTLDEQLRQHPNVTMHENHMVIDLITDNKIHDVLRDRNACRGFYVYDIENETVRTVASKGTFVATGGLGKVFMYTSNPDVASGDGFAFCYRAGLPLANMEFIQFHPSVYYDVAAKGEFGRRQLFTEGLRGEGAILKCFKDSKDDLVLKYHPDGSKSTRDVVTRAEDGEMRKHNLDHVWLDCTSIGEERLKKNFKSAYDFCLERGIDLAKEPVPVVYAVHYSNGGVLCGHHGETALEGCYVVGEVAYTGVHGATRLASNSGTECIEFADRSTNHYLKHVDKQSNIQKVPLWDVGEATESRDQTTVNHYWESIRRTMNSLCGMVRNEQRLEAGLEDIDSFQTTINKLYWKYHVNKDFLELRNIADLAKQIMKSAYLRKETRACHVRCDYPEQDDQNFLGWTLVQRGREPYIQALKQ